MSSETLILIDEHNYRQYNLSIEELSFNQNWQYFQTIYPHLAPYSQFSTYWQYVCDHNEGSVIGDVVTLPNERFGVLSRIHVNPVYQNSLTRISTYHNSRANPVTQLDETKNPMPIAVRYINQNGDHFIEHYPFQTTVTFSDQRRKPYITEAQQIQIWIPWTLMQINMQQGGYQYLYAAGHSLMSNDDPYFVAPFPNTYAEGNICWSNSLADYEGMAFDYTNHSYGVDLKTFYSIAFNEYFSGGWNTDLGSTLANTLYYHYSLYCNRFDEFPMLKQFVRPTAEYVNEHLPQLTAARRRMIANGLLASMQSRLKSTAYVLYMLSTFTLEETLQFWNEITSLKSLPNAHMVSIKKFENLITNTSSATAPMELNGFDWGNINTNIVQSHPLMTNQIQDAVSNRPMYVYMYNLTPGHNDANMLLRHATVSMAYSSVYFIKEMHNQMCIDFVRTGLHDFENRYLYMVDYANKTWTKILIPESERIESELLSMQQKYDLNVAMHALAAHSNASNIVKAV